MMLQDLTVTSTSIISFLFLPHLWEEFKVGTISLI